MSGPWTASAGGPGTSRAAGERPTGDEARARAAELLAEVRERGDAAVRELTERFDGVRLERTRVDAVELRRALDALDPALRHALEEAAANIRSVHLAQSFREEAVEVAPGVRVWRMWRPLERVGLYVPGGRARYPSTVLMLALPAGIAGCREIVLCSPPGPDGRIAPAVLAAAALGGVTEVHSIGGVQAVGAMAFGTESVRRVDKLFGPGSRYVTAAKLLVFGEVAVDMPAGPSEVVVVADASCPAAWVAADMRAQVEHAEDARAMLVTHEPRLAAEVGAALAEELGTRAEIHLVAGLEAAVRFADGLAPEHLILACAEPERWLPLVSRAGSLFLGLHAPAAAGDYATGANHVLPTGGAGRAFSALGLADFGRTVQVQSVDVEGLRRLRGIVGTIAEAEGLFAHAESVRVRCEGDRVPPPASGPLAPPRRPRVREALSRMRPYEWEPATAEVAAVAGIREARVIRFDTNTSPWTPPAPAGPPPVLNEYPDAGYRDLTGAFAGYIGVPPEAITVGAGADEVLDLLARAFVGPGDAVITSRPAYSMFEVVSEIAGARLEGIPAVAMDLDRSRFLSAARRARLVWLCNPNNPTGELVGLDYIEELARATAAVVVVDEAYFEYSGTTAAGMIGALPNLAVVRTMSKAFGLAGARVGCAVSGPGIAAALRMVRPPGSVGVAAAALAVAALRDAGQMRGRVAGILRERTRLLAEVRALGIEARGSEANFLLVRAGGAAPALLRSGLVVRTFAPGSALAGWIRITVRTRADDDRLLQGLAAWRGRDGG
ncbi:MAG: histidinol dehydrogenase [Candidatus Dormibacteraceae bacterium]